VVEKLRKKQGSELNVTEQTASQKVAKELFRKAAEATSVGKVRKVFREVKEALKENRISNTVAYSALMTLGGNCEQLYQEKKSKEVLKLAAEVYGKAAECAKRESSKAKCLALKAMALSQLAADEDLDPEERAQYWENAAYALKDAFHLNRKEIVDLSFAGRTHHITQSDTNTMLRRAAVMYMEKGEEEQKKFVREHSEKARECYISAYRCAIKAGDVKLAATAIEKVPSSYRLLVLAETLQEESISIELRKQLIPLLRDSALHYTDLGIYWGVIDPDAIANKFFSIMDGAYQSVRDPSLKQAIKDIEEDVMNTEGREYLKKYYYERNE